MNYLEKGQIISAREGLLRASNYYRTAEYGTPPSDQRARLLWQKSVDCFHQACPLFDPPVLPVEIPFEGKVLPGYFWSPDSSGKPRPTLIAVGGNDSSGEEIFFSSGPGAVRHGYNYFTFEYPGHRGAVYLNPAFVKRPDYQPVFKAAIDFLQTLPGVDQRIALSGFSFGGYVVSQVAVHEKRIKAVIPDSPIVNLNGVFEDFWAPAFRKLRFFPRSIRKIIVDRQINKSPLKAAMAQYSLWTWGMAGKSMLDWLEGGYAKAFSVVDDLPKIECAALALVSEDEGAELVHQAKLFYDCISSTQKNIHIFSLSKGRVQ